MAATAKKSTTSSSSMVASAASEWPQSMVDMKPIVDISDTLTHGYRIVLLSTGSYNPVHRMHVSMFEHVKSSLESAGHVVVGAFISPSHDAYLAGKMKKTPSVHIKANHRLSMCQLAVGESKWLSTSSWETNQSHFIDFPDVSRSLLGRIQVRFSPLTYGPIRVYYVCGADLASKCGLGRGIDRDINVAVMPRPGYTVRNVDPKACHLVRSGMEVDMSSTAVRAACKIKDFVKLNTLLPSSVLHYMQQHRLLGLPLPPSTPVATASPATSAPSLTPPSTITSNLTSALSTSAATSV